MLNPCNLCESNLFEIAAKSKDFLSNSTKTYTLYKCKVCDLHQILPIPSKQEIDSFYTLDYPGNFVDTDILEDGISNKFKNFIYLSYRKVFKSFYTERVSIHKYRVNKGLDKLSILDIGCGDGNFLISLKKSNYELYGIDIDSEVIENLKNRYQIKGEVTTIGDFKTNKKFDVISMSHFLEHSPDPKKTLEKVKSLLKKDGLLLLKLPNINSLSFKIFGRYCYSLDIPRHLFMFSPKTISNYLELSGFEVMECKTNLEKYIFPSIFNILDFGAVRKKVTGNMIFSIIYFTSDLLFSIFFNLILFPIYIFSEKEEIRVQARLK